MAMAQWPPPPVAELPDPEGRDGADRAATGAHGPGPFRPTPAPRGGADGAPEDGADPSGPEPGEVREAVLEDERARAREAGRAEGHAEGWAAGHAEGRAAGLEEARADRRAEAQAEAEAHRAALARLERGVREALGTLDAELEGELVHLVATLVRKVVVAEARLNDAVLPALVQEAAQALRGDLDGAVVHLNPSDAERVDPECIGLPVHADSALPEGSLRLERGATRIDDRIDERLEAAILRVLGPGAGTGGPGTDPSPAPVADREGTP